MNDPKTEPLAVLADEDNAPVRKDGILLPANYSFGAINAFVHDDVSFEELQWAMLGMAGELDALRADKARLDWLLEPSNMTMRITDEENDDWIVDRAAIDEAKEGQTK